MESAGLRNLAFWMGAWTATMCNLDMLPLDFLLQIESFSALKSVIT